MTTKKQLAVWPYFALALFSGVIGAVMLFHNLDSEFPGEKDLQKISGTIDTMFLIDDLSGERTGIMKPMNSIHLTLDGVAGEFRYPSSWPGYNKIWRQLSFHVDLWIDKSAIGNDEPIVIYRIEQEVPENWVVEPLSVSFKEIADSQGSSKRSYVHTGAWLMAGSVGFVLIALLLHIRNRRNPRPDPKWFPPDS